MLLADILPFTIKCLLSNPGMDAALWAGRIIAAIMGIGVDDLAAFGASVGTCLMGCAVGRS